MNQTIFALRTVLLVLVAVFCLTDVAAVAGAQRIDACTLLTKAEIQAAVGQNVGDGKLNDKANPAVGAPCDYKVGDFGTFSMLARTAGPGETADKTMAELKKMKIAVSEAPGIGDSSFFANHGYGMIQLNTFKGSNYLIITMTIPGVAEPAQKTAAEKLMRTALTKL